MSYAYIWYVLGMLRPVLRCFDLCWEQGYKDTCVSYEEEDTCVSYEVFRPVLGTRIQGYMCVIWGGGYMRVIWGVSTCVGNNTFKKISHFFHFLFWKLYTTRFSFNSTQHRSQTFSCRGLGPQSRGRGRPLAGGRDRPLAAGKAYLFPKMRQSLTEVVKNN
jgi:hypothetical protein